VAQAGWRLPMSARSFALGSSNSAVGPVRERQISEYSREAEHAPSGLQQEQQQLRPDEAAWRFGAKRQKQKIGASGK
jgi:hypothetical protein